MKSHNHPHTAQAITRAALAICLLAGMALNACREREHNPFVHTPKRAIYHWKTTFAPTAGELAFMNRHRVGRIYVHYFDVALRDGMVQPEGTVRFTCEVPDTMDVVPTVYVTTEALRAIADEDANHVRTVDEYAQRIVTRIEAITRHNHIAHAGEVQIDCDWTASLRNTYFALLKGIRARLHDAGIALSVTVRLHQLRQDAPPADMGVLMLYNTGNVMDPDTRNSILDIDDVEPYLMRPVNYALPLDLAYPIFGWQVCYSGGQFERLASPGDTTTAGSAVRREQADYATVRQVQLLAERQVRGAHSTVIYHLDNQFIDLFTDEQIDTLYAAGR